MKKLAELNWVETKTIIVGLNAELAILSQDTKFVELMNDLKNFQNSDKPQLKIITSLFDFLLSTHEQSLDNILALIMQVTVKELQEVKNIDIVKTSISFFSIEIYKNALVNALKSV